MGERLDKRRLIGTGLGAALLATSALPTPGLAQASPAPAGTALGPDVLLLYVDDVSLNERHLWCDEQRTPVLARFCREGVEFTNAVSSTPLCGPSRASLLTGRYGHDHGITFNQAGIELFDPSVTLATQMQGAGYHTLFAGKYINGLSVADEAEVAVYAAGWDEFDVIWRRHDQRARHFYDYELWTRDGVVRKRNEPADHSTRMVAEQLADHIRAAPADAPVLAMASFYSGHAPNIAMDRHVGDKRCRDVPPWDGPSYNEADVSDKPAYVRALPRLDQPAYELRKHCEEMLSVDWAAGHILEALEDTGRLDDTLVIFTSDNGFMLGDHRRPRGKDWPYAIPVHLQMLWPSVLGEERRVVTEPVSNVDLAPTLCALAGCEMPAADGASMGSLITGERDQLERSFVYTENLHQVNDMPPWYGLVTTGAFRDGPWQYTELGTGERELYDLVADPFRLENVAGDPSRAELVAELHELLHSEVIEPAAVTLHSGEASAATSEDEGVD